jgi:DNA-binding beta-propeller fold protein YncE
VDDALTSPRGVAASPDGAHVYVTSLEAGGIGIRQRDAATLLGEPHGLAVALDGALRDVASVGEEGVDGLEGPFGVALSPDGRPAYVAAGDSAVSVFLPEPAAGALAAAALGALAPDGSRVRRARR